VHCQRRAIGGRLSSASGVGPNMIIVFIEVRVEKIMKIGLRDLFLGVKWGI
jgi:hypothetical protein